MKTLRESEVAIVGLGLMGGSLAGALRGKCRAVVGIARRKETVEQAISDGLIDLGTTDMEPAVGSADIVVLATPVRAIIELVNELGPLLQDDALLIDLGSTKSDITRAMADLPPHVQPLGAHPMCGKELSGISAADPRLYEGRTFILVPLPRTSLQAIETGRDLARAIGALPLILDDPHRHDFLVATLSHLPYLLACSLVAAADATTSQDEAAWEIVAGGYRDTSRVAASDVDMMVDIIMTNRQEILEALAEYSSHLDQLTQLIRTADERGLRMKLSYAREKRMEMFP